jgi:hypothetical protein
MKKFFIAAICLLAGLALFLFYKSKQSTTTTGDQSARISAAGESTAPVAGRPAGVAPNSSTVNINAAGGAKAPNPESSSPQQPQDLSAKAGIYAPPPDATSNVPQDAVVRNVRRAVREYGQMFGGDPVGNNPEITAELTGKNPKQINFLTDVEGMTVNQNGELVDQWGTPYFFHQLSGSDMEVRSAGPDRKMWTSDDIVTR